MTPTTRVRTVYGDLYRVATADLQNPARIMLPLYTRAGLKWCTTPAADRPENRGKAIALHRENIASDHTLV